MDFFQILFARVAPQHARQDFRGARLHRQVNLVAQGGMGIDGLDDVGSEVSRMRSGEPHAPHAWNFGHAREQFRKAPAGRRRIPPGIHDLAQNLDFRVTRVHQAAGLGHNLLARTAALRAARHGHNAERAALVAAFDDGQISAEADCRGGSTRSQSNPRCRAKDPSPAGFRIRAGPATPAACE